MGENNADSEVLFPDSPVEIAIAQGQLFPGPGSHTGNEKTCCVSPRLKFLVWMVLGPF